MKPTLLLTAAIDPKVSDTPLTFITKAEVRLAQYRQTLDQMIRSKCFEKIIFCENTNHEIDFSNENTLAKEMGMRFEHLRFQGNYEKIHLQGKGYGEGEIIAHALNNSSLMLESDHFYKLTGRIQINNIEDLILPDSRKNVFFRNRSGEESADTRFFSCQKIFYKEHLMDCYLEVNDLQGEYLEKVFYKKLKPLAEKISSFPSYPRYSGYAGSTGQSYALSPLKYWWYQILFKSGKLSI